MAIPYQRHNHHPDRRRGLLLLPGHARDDAGPVAQRRGARVGAAAATAQEQGRAQHRPVVVGQARLHQPSALHSVLVGCHHGRARGLRRAEPVPAVDEVPLGRLHPGPDQHISSRGAGRGHRVELFGRSARRRHREEGAHGGPGLLATAGFGRDAHGPDVAVRRHLLRVLPLRHELHGQSGVLWLGKHHHSARRG